MKPSLTLRKNNTGPTKKKFHFHYKNSATTVAYSSTSELEGLDDIGTSVKKSQKGTSAFHTLTATSSSSSSSSSCTKKIDPNRSISYFFKPISNNNVLEKTKWHPVTDYTTPPLPSKFPLSTRRSEIPVGTATILRNTSQENRPPDYNQSSNHVNRAGITPKLTSKRVFSEFEETSDTDFEFSTRPSGIKRHKQASYDDETEKEKIIDDCQDPCQDIAHFCQGPCQDIEHFCQELETNFELNIPSPPPPEYLSPCNSQEPPSSNGQLSDIPILENLPSESYQANRLSENYQAGRLSENYQADRPSENYQAYRLSENYQADRLSENYQADRSSENYQADSLSENYQADSLSENYQADRLSENYQAESCVSKEATVDEKLSKACEDYVNVLEEIANTFKTIDDDLLKNILGNGEHQKLKKNQIERNRLRAEKKRLNSKVKQKLAVQTTIPLSSPSNLSNEYLDRSSSLSTGNSNTTSNSNAFPTCGESFYEKSPPILQRTYTSSNNTTPALPSNSLHHLRQLDIIDLSCEGDDELDTWSTVPSTRDTRSSSTPAYTPSGNDTRQRGPMDTSAGEPFSRDTRSLSTLAAYAPSTATSDSRQRGPMDSSAGKPSQLNDKTPRWNDSSCGKRSTPKASGGTVKNIGNSLPDDGYRSEFKKSDYVFSRDMYKALRQSFGLKCFRSNQHEAITASLLDKDCFILMPTGGGKSLCYQLPAIISSGVTFVVSPLKSLIQDQVSKLVSNHIPAFQLTGETPMQVVSDIYRDLSCNEPQTKLLYVTPEKLSASSQLASALLGLYNRQKLSRFVIDEAHCVSQWGHDFRPDYKKLSALKAKFPRVPMMALTATATPRVRKDIVTQLKMKTPMWFSQSFNRPNLQFLLRPKKKIMQEIIEQIKTNHAHESGIVYCLSRIECDKVAKELANAGIQAVAYHAGLSDPNRARTQEDWIRDRCKVICATIAFGMGIDKAAVRFVFHYSLPKSLEGYFQECGRAGRDGQNAVCILFYSYSDVYRLKRMVQSDPSQSKESVGVHMNNLYRVVQYCENQSECRRAQLLEYFGETGFNIADCRRNTMTICDNCASADEMVQLDVLPEAKLIVESVNTLIHRGNSNWRRPAAQLTLNHLVDVFKGSQNAKVEKESLNLCSMYGKGEQKFCRNNAERLFRMLVMQDILAEDLTVGAHSQVIGYVKLGPKAMGLLNGNTKLPRFLIRNAAKRSSKSKETSSSTSRGANDDCYQQLVCCCKTLAEDRRLKPEHIFADSTLRQMADKLPMTREEMLDIEGVTEYKMENFGQQFLELTIAFSGAFLGSTDDAANTEMDDAMGLDNHNRQGGEGESPYWASAGNISGNNKRSKSKFRKKKGFQSKKKNNWNNQSTAKSKTTSKKAPPPPASSTSAVASNPLAKSYQQFSKGRNFGSGGRTLGFLSLPGKK